MIPSSGSMTSPVPDTMNECSRSATASSGFKATQDAIGAPVLRQFDRGTWQIAPILLEFGLKFGKERKRIRGSPRKARQNLIMIDAADFACAVLEHHVVKTDLPVPGHGHLPAMANGNDCRRMNHVTTPCASPWMGVAINRLQMAGAHMGVLLRRRQTGMPQQLLDDPEISPRIEEMCGKGMPKGMRADALQLSDLRRCTRHDRTHTAHAQPSTTCVQEQRLRPRRRLSSLPRRRRELFVAGQVGLQGRQSGLSRREAAAPCLPCHAHARSAAPGQGRHDSGQSTR